MKKMNLLICISLLAVATSCEWMFSSHEPESVGYNISFCFRDDSGNNLFKDINLTDSIYRLDIIISEPCNRWDNDIYNSPGSTLLRPRFSSAGSYLESYFYLFSDNCPPMKKLTHKIQFPALFGDDSVREIISYWDVPRKAKSSTRYATCFRIEFEGKEIIPTQRDDRPLSLATIIVD